MSVNLVSCSSGPKSHAHPISPRGRDFAKSEQNTHTHTPQSWQTICSINTKLCVCTWTRISVWVHCALAHALLYIQSVSLHVIFFMDFYLFLKLLLRHHLTWRLPSPSLHTAELISPPYNFCACKYLYFYIYHIGGDIAHLDGQGQRQYKMTRSSDPQTSISRK